MAGRKVHFAVTAILWLLIAACSSNRQKKPVYDTPQQGTIHISVDESFKPVISEQIKVYESSNPQTKIVAEYKSEADCLRDLQQDSTRMVIIARGLKKTEEDFYVSKLSYHPRFDVLAFDAVTVIVNSNGQDSVFTLQQLKNYLNGKDSSKTIVLDGKNATSTVRFLQDSILRGESFGKTVMAAQGSRQVVDFVANNTNAIGFVGSSWVGNEQDPEQEMYKNKIRMALLECKSCEKDIFAKPSQATITYSQYPLVRPLYYVLKENALGLGTGFMNFMSLERGQLIFRRAYLVPAKMYFGVRTSDIKEENTD
ncbi:PstS family phosphate ABC transporter substrate-binding protein [Foetidibacter luteolus]|uniref:PstS family phosphate ABC transporter substrate-binding protein n=1 Tax=Foetidibacter luteolus TaxID=2608880 RepID=UPI001A98D4B7|nr:substrate-binding domain-containing protein [Foetidibacter luteolus]